MRSRQKLVEYGFKKNEIFYANWRERMEREKKLIVLKRNELETKNLFFSNRKFVVYYTCYLLITTDGTNLSGIVFGRNWTSYITEDKALSCKGLITEQESYFFLLKTESHLVAIVYQSICIIF